MSKKQNEVATSAPVEVVAAAEPENINEPINFEKLVKNLDEQIAYYKALNEKSNQRCKLLGVLESLHEMLLTSKTIDPSGLGSDDPKLPSISFTKDNYSSPCFIIKNQSIIRDVINFTIDIVNLKIRQLEEEIING